mgnify:CR=1 FL=1
MKKIWVLQRRKKLLPLTNAVHVTIIQDFVEQPKLKHWEGCLYPLDIVSLPNLGQIVTRTFSVNKDSLVETTHCGKYFELSIHWYKEDNSLLNIYLVCYVFHEGFIIFKQIITLMIECTLCSHIGKHLQNG